MGVTPQFITLTRLDLSGGRRRTWPLRLMIGQIVSWAPSEHGGMSTVPTTGPSYVLTTAGTGFVVEEAVDEIDAVLENLP